MLSARWGGCTSSGSAAAQLPPLDSGADSLQPLSRSGVVGHIQTIAGLQRTRANEAEYQLTGRPTAAGAKHSRWQRPPWSRPLTLVLQCPASRACLRSENCVQVGTQSELPWCAEDALLLRGGPIASRRR